MKCDFENCDKAVEYMSSRWTTRNSDFPNDMQDLVEDGTISGDGLLVEYWCKDHCPSIAEYIENGEECSDIPLATLDVMEHNARHTEQG